MNKDFTITIPVKINVKAKNHKAAEQLARKKAASISNDAAMKQYNIDTDSIFVEQK